MLSEELGINNSPPEAKCGWQENTYGFCCLGPSWAKKHWEAGLSHLHCTECTLGSTEWGTVNKTTHLRHFRRARHKGGRIWERLGSDALSHRLGNLDTASTALSAALPLSTFSCAVASSYLSLSLPLSHTLARITYDLDINCVPTESDHSTPPACAQGS